MLPWIMSQYGEDMLGRSRSVDVDVDRVRGRSIYPNGHLEVHCCQFCIMVDSTESL